MWSGNISRIPIVWSSLLTFSSKYEFNHEMNRNMILLHRFTYKTQTTRRTFLPLLYSSPPCFQEKQCSSAWSPVYIPSADMIIFQWCKHTHTVSSASCYGFWLTKKLMSSWQYLLSTEAKGQSAEQTMKHRAEISEAPTHIHWHTRASQVARPDFTELDVFLGQHILLTLGQHFNPKM